MKGNYKKISILITIIIYGFSLQAQIAKLNESISIEFNSSRHFEIEIEKGETLEYDFDNDSISVVIYTLSDSVDVSDFRINPEKSVSEFLQIVDIKEKGEVKKVGHLKNAYYQIGEDWEVNKHNTYPIILILMYDEVLNALLNIEIECYESTIDEGMSILNSLRVIKQ